MFAVSCSMELYDARVLNRKRSMKVRALAESYDCRWCQRSFSKPYNLYIHERSHATGLYHCDICGKGFRSKENMKCHKMMHTPPVQKQLAGIMTECAAY
ncbi:protein drumstick [Eurytemora carolleeae]|uniref:protein drumstick n=1 Tax=Eurytemora carolleeae TaxID=1294199 RepID=UPI000C78741F|nr:protein drumstick [Eurytemora carolleeae]|eukprot:XP_023335997.1 protein drumstick-like [Eurytemora affinis]